MRGCSGGHAWLLGGHAWLLWGGMRGFFWGGMHGFFWGACMVFSGGVCVGYDEIRSMSGRYASYWNAFLFDECNCHVENIFVVFFKNSDSMTLIQLKIAETIVYHIVVVEMIIMCHCIETLGPSIVHGITEIQSGYTRPKRRQRYLGSAGTKSPQRICASIIQQTRL